MLVTLFQWRRKLSFGSNLLPFDARIVFMTPTVHKKQAWQVRWAFFLVSFVLTSDDVLNGIDTVRICLLFLLLAHTVVISDFKQCYDLEMTENIKFPTTTCNEVEGEHTDCSSDETNNLCVDELEKASPLLELHFVIKGMKEIYQVELFFR